MFGVSPSAATLMIKPVGATCNLRCEYCYYLPVQDELYGGRCKRMGTDTLEAVFAAWLPRAEDQVTISWQGGEPTLAGLDFFREAMRLVDRHRRAGQTVNHALQTNGTRLDDDWCAFFCQHAFLIGISIDGEPGQHDHYRLDPAGRGTYDRVRRGLELLRQHGVEHNLLCVLNDQNLRAPLRLYRRLRDLSGNGSRWLQFIPGIEWVDQATGEPHDGTPGSDGGKSTGTPVLAPFSPDREAYGEFLCTVFDEWFAHDRHEVSIRLFDNVLSVMLGRPAVECTHGPACHTQVTVEHNGDVFGCDHYVQRRWQLGKTGQTRASGSPGLNTSLIPLTVRDTDTSDAAAKSVAVSPDWFDTLDQPKMQRFADRKLDLPEPCEACEYRRFCHGGCPKHRPHRGELPEASVLCGGYRRFFAHSMERFEWLAEFLRRGELPPPPGRAGGQRSAKPRTRPRSGGASRLSRKQRSRSRRRSR